MEGSIAIVWSVVGVVVAGFVVNLVLELFDKGKFKHLVDKMVYALVISIAAGTIIKGINAAVSIMNSVK